MATHSSAFTCAGLSWVARLPRIKIGLVGFPSLVAQWLRICLPMQGTWVRALVREDPTCRGAAGPVSHNYWACASEACAPQQERPRQWEARAPRWRVAPARRNWRKPSHRNEDPTHWKINKFIKKKKKKNHLGSLVIQILKKKKLTWCYSPVTSLFCHPSPRETHTYTHTCTLIEIYYLDNILTQRSS